MITLQTDKLGPIQQKFLETIYVKKYKRKKCKENKLDIDYN